MTVDLKGGKPKTTASIPATDVNSGEITSPHGEPVPHSPAGDPASTSMVPPWVWWLLSLKVVAVVALVLAVLVYW